MSQQNISFEVDASGLRALLADRSGDPRALHDALRNVASSMEATDRPVPADLRRALEELEADIAEAYFNNVPI